MRAAEKRREVVCEKGKISYTLTRKPVKNVNLRIKPDGAVLVSASPRVPVKFIDGFIRQKQDYIFAALEMYGKRRESMASVLVQYADGEIYTLLGEKFLLRVEESRQEAVFLDGPHIVLRVKDATDAGRKEKLMEAWLKKYQMRVFEETLRAWYPHFAPYGVPYPALKVRNMKSRWGSCHTAKGIITLNAQLIQKPKRCIDYVAVHEYSHLIHPNHSKQFWEFVAGVMPDWKEQKRKLQATEIM